MSLIDVLFRVDSICQKYDKYDVEKHRNLSSSDDAFCRLYASFESQIDTTVRKAEIVATETHRAKVVAMNAEIRRTKARLMEEIPKLQKLARKKVKGITQEEIETRTDLVFSLPDRIKAIPEGTSNAAKQTGGWGTSTSNKNIKFENSDGQFADEFFQQSEESSQFREEYEMRKMKQDEGLDVISEGLDTLKNLAQDMNEELDRQVPLMDEIDTKADQANTNLRNTNVKLKYTVVKMRSSQNFCIDIILMCIILGIAAYLFNTLN